MFFIQEVFSMKNTKPIALLLLSASLLMGCSPESGGDKSSSASSSETSSSDGDSSQTSKESSQDSSSSSEIEDDKISVEDAYYQIAKTQAQEISGASSTHFETESKGARLTNSTSETYIAYADGSTSSSGTYTRKEEGKDDAISAFKRFAGKVTDTYEIDGENQSYDMFVQVTDFSDDISTNSSYSDSASKKFIIASKDDIGNLEEGEYILASDFSLYASANLTAKLANFLASNVVGNAYAEQCGATKVLYKLDSENNWNYSLSYSYNYNESGQNVATEVSLSYVLNFDKTRLLSYSTLNQVTYTNNEDATDYSVSSLKESGTIEYGTRAEAMGSDALNPDDYFLQSVTEVALNARMASDWTKYNKVEYEDGGYALSTSYSQIYGLANTYSPSKALSLELSPTASSNEDVIALENGIFVIKGEGSADLTFSYYRKMPSTGVYKLTSIKAKNVTIATAKAEKIDFVSKGDIYLHQGLTIGSTYTWNYRITPTQADQAVTVSSSNEDVLEASFTNNGTITLKPKSEGVVTVTLTSVSEPSVTVSKTFYVLPDMDFASFLSSHTFTYTNPWGNTRVVSFDGNGNGSVVVSSASGDTSVTETFTYSLNGSEITFDYDSVSGLASFEDGRIVARLNDETGEFLGLGIAIASSDYSTYVYTIAE